MQKRNEISPQIIYIIDQYLPSHPHSQTNWEYKTKKEQMTFTMTRALSKHRINFRRLISSPSILTVIHTIYSGILCTLYSTLLSSWSINKSQHRSFLRVRGYRCHHILLSLLLLLLLLMRLITH